MDLEQRWYNQNCIKGNGAECVTADEGGKVQYEADYIRGKKENWI